MSDPTVYAWDRERDDYVSDAGVRCSAPRVVGLDDYAILRAEVERQRQLIEDIDASGIHSCHDHCQRLECAQRREIERPRAEVTESRRCETESYQVSEWLQREHDKLRTRLAEARDLLTLAAGVALLPSGVPALPLAIRERIAAWLRAQEPPR